MRRAGGFTIVQIMVLVGVLGLVIFFASNKLIDMRCKEDPAKQMCKDRSAKR